MKTRRSLPLILLWALLLILTVPYAVPSVLAQTATPTPAAPNFAQAVALFQALPPTATNADKVAALGAVVSASDIPSDQLGDWTYKLAAAQVLLNSKNFALFIPTFYAAYQAGNLDSFVDYLDKSITAGNPYKSTALSNASAFMTAQTGTVYAMVVQAQVAETQTPADPAFAFWNTVIAANPTWNKWRGMAIVHVGKLSIARGDSPRQTDMILMPLLTSVRVPYVDMNYVWAYRLLNFNTLSLNGSQPVVTPTELKAFLQAVLNNIDPNANRGFAIGVQAQLSAAN